MRNRQAHPWGIALRGRLNGSFTLPRHVGLRLAGTVVVVASGCASPAPPKPPTLNLPALATDIQARRLGPQVTLHWTTPSNTSDGLPFKGTMTAEICREVGARPQSPAARLTACAPVLRLAVTPGRSEAVDDLPANLQSDPVTLLTYRVQLFNAAGRSAGESAVAGFAAAGTPPPTVDDLRASNLEAGAVLEWKPASTPAIVELERTALSTPSAPHQPATKPTPAPAPSSQPGASKPKTKSKKSNKPAKTAASHPAKSASASPSDQQAKVRLRVTESATLSASTPTGHGDGTVDLTAQMGATYRYVANRVRPVTIGIHKLEIESAPSQTVVFAHLDVFPPQRPTGLEAIPGSDPQHPAAIDLSWEPNGEADLAGYLLYRQPVDASGAPTGPAVQVTASPIPAPAFSDLTAVAGESYAYQVVAVDQTGNRSPLSDRVLQAAAH
jgi:hypothetical protein